MYDWNQICAVCIIPMEDSRVARISWFNVSNAEHRSRGIISESNLDKVELWTLLSMCISAVSVLLFLVFAFWYLFSMLLSKFYRDI